ncbi:MAG: ribonuclease E activity regulator RraA [Gammaproteobacteria bacterium]|nr:MAG: RraA family protein [Gammaproteobacteria bacterium]UCH39202.1 MAG: ribonuclease E activity regulator RraA [Gammaproteobacteria bacterium]
MSFKTADLSDEHADRVQIVSPGLRNFGGKTRFRGPVVTVKSFNDNSKVRELIWSPGEGRVLVIDNEASMSCAMFGDMMAARAIENGWAGVVINGCIRDSVDIAGMDIGVKALATNPLRSVKEGRGEVDIELEFLGATFRPGEYLYSDEDGILLSSEPLL